MQALVPGGIALLAALTLSCTGHARRPERPAPPPAPTPCGVVASPMRMLTNAEYANAVRDLVGVTSNDVSWLPERLTKDGFDNDVDLIATSISDAGLDAYARAARSLAEAAVAKQEGFLPEACRDAGDEACRVRFLGAFLTRAFRRPATPAERDRYVRLWRDAGSWDEGLAAVLEAVFQSAAFLYLDEGAGRGAAAGASPLTSYERAARLALFLTKSIPDAALAEAASRGELDTRAGVERHARRLLETPAAREALRSFYLQWLDLTEAEGLNRSEKMYPRFTAGVKGVVRQETERLVDHVVWDRRGGLRELLTTPTAIVNAPLAAFYGVDAPAAGWGQVSLDPRRRPGVLTRIAWTGVHAHADQTSPILRGVALRTRLLCQPPPPPPPAVVSRPPEVSAGAGTRERFEDHRSDVSCAACHRLIDGIGFGFENYDSAGGWRDTEGDGVPIDASGDIVGASDPSLNGPFVGADGLMQRLAGSAQVHDCLARQVFRYALGRSERPVDTCSLQQLRERAGPTAPLVELLVAMTGTDAFLFARR